MDTQVRTPQLVFMQPQRLIVPLFQRPYVWSKENQWEPLWADVTRVADRLLAAPTAQHQPHFLGAEAELRPTQRSSGHVDRRVDSGAYAVDDSGGARHRARPAGTQVRVREVGGTSHGEKVDVAALIGAGLIEPGTTLWARRKAHSDRTATVLPDGPLDVDGTAFQAPSGAARHISGESENGWWYFLIDPSSRPVGGRGASC